MKEAKQLTKRKSLDFCQWKKPSWQRRLGSTLMGQTSNKKGQGGF